ncbi:MAG: DUF7282 domain-containing protein [Salinarimonas sp.]
MTKTRILIAAAAALAFAGPAAADHLDIEADGVRVDGAMVTFPSVKIDEPGFLVLHAVVGGEVVVPASIGHVMVPAGTTADVTVTADYPLAAGEDYIAMLHYDTDGDGAYEFGEGSTDVDGPALNAEGQPYVKPFTGM